MGVQEDEWIAKGLAMFRDQTTDYVRRMSVGIVYRLRSSGQFKIGSGFLAGSNRRLGLVTAGHVLEEVAKLRDENDLSLFRLCYYIQKNGLETYELEPSKVVIHTQNDGKSIDLGVVATPAKFVQRFLDVGSFPVPLANLGVTDPESQTKVTLLTGFAASHSNEIVKDRLHFYENGKVSTRVRKDIGVLAHRTIPITGIENASDGFTKAGVVLDNEASVEGMSGGLIIEFNQTVETPLNEFAVIGVQSRQWMASDAVRSVAFTSSQRVTDFVSEVQKIPNDENESRWFH